MNGRFTKKRPEINKGIVENTTSYLISDILTLSFTKNFETLRSSFERPILF